MKILSAEFVTSAAAAGSHAGIPRDGLAQVAVTGRSNVGKSSLLNALCRAKIARTSAAPGKTRLANVYRVTAEGGPGGAGRWGLYFVDLPGYGYARGGPDGAEELRLVAEAYLRPRPERPLGELSERERGWGPASRERPRPERGGGAQSGEAGPPSERERGWGPASRERCEPRLVLLLVDARHPGLDSDRAAGQWLASLGITPLVVATKIDKLSRSERVRNLKSVSGMFGTAVQPVSALRGEGLDELWTTIAKIARDVGRDEGTSRAPAGPPPNHRSSS